MELPFELKKLNDDMLNVIRFLARQSNHSGDAVDIQDGLDLSNRAFGKAIRRVVTAGYVEMDMGGYYHLTSNGHKAAETLAEYDTAMGTGPLGDLPVPEDDVEPGIPRTLAMVMPSVSVSGRPFHFYATVEAPWSEAQQGLTSSPEVILRLSIPGNEPLQETVQVQPDERSAPVDFRFVVPAIAPLELKIQAFYLSRADDVVTLGDFHVELPVESQPPGDVRYRVLRREIEFQA